MLTAILAIAGFFTVGRVDDRAMFFDPEGHPFYLRGCGTVDKALDHAPELLMRCGFNAVAQPAQAMRGRGFAWTYNFNVGRRFMEKGPEFVRRNSGGHGFPNVSHPDFEKFVADFIRTNLGDKKDDPMLLGYFIDNELAFDMAEPWEIERYFAVTSRAIREVDPNHLLLGCRFMGGKITSNAKVWEECGKVCDVVSVNIYPMVDLYRRRIYVHDVYFGGDGREIDVVDLLPKLSARCKRPVIVTEWSFPALDTPLPNLVGGGCRVDTQDERARASALFILQLYSVKCMPGYFYFRWYDCDPWSEERTNYGLVSDEGVPYEPLVKAFEKVQGGFDYYFDKPPPKRREWPSLPRPFGELAARLARPGEVPSWPERVEFPLESFDSHPIGGRRAIAVWAKDGKRPSSHFRIKGTPIDDGQRWLMRYKPWPNDACFTEDGSFFGFAAPPQSDYASVKLYITKKGTVNSDISMRDGEGCFGFVLWGRGGRREYECELDELRRDWNRVVEDSNLPGTCVPRDCGRAGCASLPDDQPNLGTPPVPSFRDGAAERPDENSFAPFVAKLDEIARRAAKSFPKGSLARERTANRLKMARRCIRLGEEALASRTPDGDGWAVLALEDMQEFIRAFDGEFDAWTTSPCNATVEPRRYFASSPDEVYAALDNVRSLNGCPSVLELGEGEYHMDRVVASGYRLDVPSTKLSAQFPVFGLTNLLVVGRGPERTRIVFDDYRATGLCIVMSRNVTVKGVELDWNEAPFAEGVVKAFDRESGTVDIAAKEGALPPDDPRFAHGNRRLVCAWYDVDGHVVERPFLFVRGCGERIGDGLYRLRLDMSANDVSSAPLAVGQTIAVPDREGFLTAGCVYSDYCTFEGVTIRTARSSAFSSTHTYQEAVWKCRILPRDGMRLSTNADGFYCSRGSYISKCEFRGMNDDGTNPHGNCAKIAGRTGPRTLVLTHTSPMRIGELCQFVRSPSGVTLQLNRLVAQRELADGIEAVFARDLPDDLVVGGHDYMFTPDSDGTGFVAVDNVFSEIRNNAMVVQCPHALIERNKADHVLKGLHLCGLIYGGWCEGPAPYDVLVRENEFRDVCLGFSTGALMHSGVAACAPIADVEIAGNLVERASEQAAEFRNLADARIYGNTFVDSPLPPKFNRCERIRMNQ